MRGAGGLLVYIHNSVVARRQPKMEQENIESICLNVKGTENTSFYVCACRTSAHRTSAEYLTLFLPVQLPQTKCLSPRAKLYFWVISTLACFKVTATLICIVTLIP